MADQVPLDSYALSPMQTGMLFQNLYNPGKGLDVEQLICRIPTVNVAALKFAFDQVWATHPILHTQFNWLDTAQPTQQINHAIPLPWAELAWSGTLGDSKERLEKFLIQDRRLGFDLGKAPLMRFTLIRADENFICLVWTYHHILLDGRSLPIILQQIAEAYQAYCDGKEITLQPTRPYRDYIAWLAQQDWTAAKAAWAKRLAGVQAATSLGISSPQPPIPADEVDYRVVNSHVSSELTRRLQQFASKYSLTLNTLLQGAWALLLSRYSGEQDIVFGAVRTGRYSALNGQETDKMIGLFINTVPMRVRVESQSTVLDILKLLRTQTVQLRDAAQEHLSLVEIQKQSAVPAGKRLFESIVAFDFFDHEEILRKQHPLLENWKFELREYIGYPLTLLTYAGERLKIDLEYSRNLFDDATAERILAHFHLLLQEIIANPSRPVGQLELLTESERHLLMQWNATQVEYPHATRECIYQRFEAQAERTPDALAVVFENQSLTYRALNQKANQLAHYLRSLGVGPDTLVGICMERSLEMVIGLYGILKAGGAYVPLDPTYPAERLAFMLRDASVQVLLSQHKGLALLQGYGNILSLDDDWETIATHSTENPPKQATPQNLAYMIYTSGSTGKPKGALNTHAGIYNRLMWMQSAFSLDETDRILQKTPFGFDVSVWEFFWPLMVGARLVLARPEGHKDPAYLIKLIQQQAITTLHFVPPMLSAFLDADGVEDCTSLKRVMCSGEALPVDLSNRFFTRLRAELHNLYGPTEAAVDVSWWACRPHESLPNTPIGRPIANTQLYILNESLQQVPIGVAGELHIGGVQVGQGYLNRAELTAEKFIANPFVDGRRSLDGGRWTVDRGFHRPPSTVYRRLYKTGDLARYLPDGNIEYLGRMDQQVKIRGFRIELGEIEAVLSEYPAVQSAVVTARPDAQGQKRLVGYVTLKGGGSDLQAEHMTGLRRHLKDKLPEYMIPGALVVLPQLPLSPNGKIDRNALPEPDDATLVRSHDYVPPQTAAEKTLAQIWAQLLSLERVGRHDNFFELGGDSIVSLQFISRAQAKGFYLTPRQVFEAPTIAALAEIAQPANAIQAEQGLVTGAVPLTPIQHWFFENHSVNPHHFNQSVRLTAPRPMDMDLLNRTVEHLQSQHDALRLRFQPGENGWQQQITSEIQPASEIVSRVDVSTLSPAAQTQRIEAVSTRLQSSLNISNGPLFKVVCFHLGSDLPEPLHIIIHHLAVDYLSWQIFITDLWTVYEQLAAGLPAQFPAKSSSFKAWGEWLNTLTAQDEFPYWEAIGQQGIAPLPLDHPDQRQHNRGADSAQVTGNLSVSETESLLRDVPDVYHTQINDILLTALLQTFAAWTGQNTLLIDLEGHGREADTLDLSRTLGWFTSLFPVCLRLDVSESGALIKSVKEQLRRIPQKGLGYSVLRYLNPQTAVPLAALPQAEVAFNYGGQLKTVSVQLSNNDRAADEDLGYLLNINAAVVDGELSVSWRYSRHIYQRETIERLCHGFLLNLKAIIAHCQAPEAGGHTPSDFPLAHLSQSALDQLLSQDNNIADLYPLSPMQAGMLFHSISAPDSGVYYIQTEFEISGALDVPRFKQAWQAVLNRHSILRTAFRWQALDEPLQVVYKQVNLPWDEQNWRTVPASAQHERLEQLLLQDRQQGFDLSHAPLTKCTLIRLDAERYAFVWHCHHLLTDGWSLPLLFREVFDLYAQPNLPQSPARPYRDYIAWLGQQDDRLAEGFWRERLAGFREPTSLGVDRVFPDAGYQTFEQILPDALTTQLTQFARQHRLTLNTLIQAGYALLLQRYSNQPEVLFGVTVSGRTAPLDGIESRLGPFLNTLPLRIPFPNGIQLIPWLEQIQQENARQTDYASTSLINIQRWSDVPAGTPLFESILVFENYPLGEDAFGRPAGLALGKFKIVEQTNFPLSIIAFPAQKDFTLSLRFDRSKFHLDSIQRMGAHLQTLLSSIAAAAPHSTPNDLSMLTEAETRQLLVEWNDSTVEYPQEKCIHALFEEQVEHNPDAVAAVFENQQLTYNELNQRANQLAHSLRRRGVGPDVLVGICVERSLEMVVGLLGILKAGGAYVPLDPAYPKERLGFMLQDSHVTILLTQQRILERLPQFDNEILCLDRDWAGIAQEDTVNPNIGVDLGNLAYIIYTSGSTGRPKGSMIEHANITRLFSATDHWFEFGPADVWTLFHSFSFDFSVWELWGALAYGGRLVIVPYITSRSPHEFYELVCNMGVTILNQTPSAFRQFIAAQNESSQSHSLRTIIFGGEMLETAMLQPWYQDKRNDGTRLINMYGITETTVHVTYKALETADAESAGASPIGRCIPDLKAYILDQYGRPVPIGVPGELHIAGDGLARGYLNRPDLTAEKFIPNRFLDGGPWTVDRGFHRPPSTVYRPEHRLYRTGDLARYLPDGNIEYLGRIDHQVKIRGFRIELGEIENVLGQHTAVRSALVLARTNKSGQPYLVAYITLKNDTLAKRKNIIPTLRTHLKQKFPVYMIPSHFVLLKDFPLTTNGKIDRQFLPSPQHSASNENRFTAPRSELERILVDIWSEVLEISPIGIHDDFFDLGGNSLLSVRLLARIQQLGLQISLRGFLENTSIAKLASAIVPGAIKTQSKDYRASQQILLAASATLLTFQPSGPRLPFFLVHPSGGSALCYASLSRILGSQQPCFGLEAVGLYDDQSADRTVEQMAVRYLHAIRKVAPTGPYCLAGWSFGGVVAFEMAQQLLQTGEQVSFLGLFDSLLPSMVRRAEPRQEISRLITWVEQFYKTNLHLSLDDLPESPDLQLELVLEKMTQLGLDVSNLEFIVQSRVLIARMRSDQALMSYQPQTYPGKITLFRAQNLTEERPPERLDPEYHNPAWGWDHYTTQPVAVDWVTGSHDDMMEHPHVKNLAKKLKTYLDQIQPKKNAALI